MEDHKNHSHSDDHGKEEHRPPEVPPKEPPGKVIHPRPSHGSL